MAKFITRTIQSTKIVIGELKLGSTEMEVIDSITEEGVVEEAKALKVIRKAFPDRNVSIVALEVSKPTQYRMDVEDFIVHAEKVEVAEQVEAELSEEQPVA